MKTQGSLLERVKDPRSDAPRSIQHDTQTIADSILRHLRRLLNSRQGEACTAPEFGIPDLTEISHGFPDSIGDMQKAIQASIEKFEPRLGKVRVKHIPSDLHALYLKFEITAQILTANEKAFLQFETLVDHSGRVDVKG